MLPRADVSGLLFKRRDRIIRGTRRSLDTGRPAAGNMPSIRLQAKDRAQVARSRSVRRQI